MADRLMKGRLIEALQRYRDEGLSWEAVAKRLYAEAGVDASGRTLAAWATEYGTSSGSREAAS